jgi:hypothetical protein
MGNDFTVTMGDFINNKSEPESNGKYAKATKTTVKSLRASKNTSALDCAITKAK